MLNGALLTLDGALVLAVTLVFLVLLVTERASYAALGIGLIIALPLTGVIDASAAVAGFSNKAVITIAGLYVVGEGLTRTGALEFLGRFLTRAGRGNETRLVILTCVAAAMMSAFLNDTAVVVVLIPILLRQATECGVPASRLLMPLSFAALLGGMTTLIGTSTNLIVSGVAEQLGAQPLSMFDLSAVGVPMAIACITVIACTSRWLLPKRASLSEMLAAAPSKDYVTELGIGAESPFIGQTCAEATERLPVTIMFVVHQGIMTPAKSFDRRLCAGDILILRGGADELLKMQEDQRLETLHDTSLDPHTVEVFEVALAPETMHNGGTIKELVFHERFGATVMAVLRAGEHLHDRVAELAVRAGDVLLVCGDEASRARIEASPEFFLLAGEPRPMGLRGRARIALLIAGIVVMLLAANSILGWKAMPPSAAAIAGGFAMAVTGCVSVRRAFDSIDWSILVFIAGTLALGEAMRVSGIAELAAHYVVGALAGHGVAAVASGIILLGFVFNFLVSHSAVAVLFTPIALAAAAQLSLDAGHAEGSPEALAIQRGLILAVCYGGSMCFATPIAHQVNLIVCGPGGYRYADFLRLGLPVSLVAWAVASVGIPFAVGLW